MRKQLNAAKVTQKDASSEDKEKRKQEKMAMMMAKFDTVRTLAAPCTPTTSNSLTFIYSKERSPRRTNSSGSCSSN